MERKLNLRYLKTSLLLFIAIAGFGQEWKEVKSIRLGGEPTSYAIDFQGNLYLGFADGRLTKYDADGAILENYALSNKSAISLIDVQNNLKPFLFYFDNQQITILDRFSSIPKNYILSDLGLEIGMLACPAPDGDFWIAENNPQRLKKINPLRKITVLEVQIPLGDSINQMQAYQNILAIGEQKKLYILDQFGGLLHTLTFDRLFNFQIQKGVIYAYTDSAIHEIDPFKGKVISSVNKPENTGPMLKSKDGFFSLLNKELVYYRRINR